MWVLCLFDPSVHPPSSTERKTFLHYILCRLTSSFASLIITTATSVSVTWPAHTVDLHGRFSAVDRLDLSYQVELHWFDLEVERCLDIWVKTCRNLVKTWSFYQTSTSDFTIVSPKCKWIYFEVKRVSPSCWHGVVKCSWNSAWPHILHVSWIELILK